MPRLYQYVGPKGIAARVRTAPAGFPVNTAGDVLSWIHQTQPRRGTRSITVTFVVDESGVLRIADRRSEHVACAGGRPVQSAGEITFSVSRGKVGVEWVTNQSTGYCPEPDSWPAVKEALDRAGIETPSGFSQEFQFRRCIRCGSINVVKDGSFVCGVCSAPLPLEWNLDSAVVAPSTSSGPAT